MKVALVKHRLIVRDEAGEHVLLAGDAVARALPSFDYDDRHTAETDYINQVALERFGIEVTALRCLRDALERGSIVRIYEMEYHGTIVQGRSGLRWFGREEIAAVQWQTPEDRTTVEDWFATVSQPQSLLPEWQHTKWWSEAHEWIVDCLDPNLAGRITKVTQRRQWDSSSVIHIVCENGEYFLKAMPEVSREREVTIFLSRNSSSLPEVVAVHPHHKWMLMRACAGTSLEHCGDLAKWASGLSAYTEIQLRCVSRTEELTGLGCPTLNLDRLADDINALVSDSAALLEGEPDGLTAAQIDYLRIQSTAFGSGLQRLAAGVIPLTIEHGDLWPGNILVNEADCRIIDWEDARLAHPFFSIAPLMAGMDTYQPTINRLVATERFREVYVDAFDSFGSKMESREVFALALPIAMFEIAIRYWRQPPAIVAVNPWMRIMVPYIASLPYSKLGCGIGWPSSSA